MNFRNNVIMKGIGGIMKTNYHTHTKRCGHAVGEDEEYIENAILANFNILGFSDHIPYPGLALKGERMREEEFYQYKESIYYLKEKYQSQIDILFAVEFEYHDCYSDYLIEIKQQCDYMICGQHYKELAFHDYGMVCADEDVITYSRDIIKAMDHGFADLVAHPDYFMLGRDHWNSTCEEASHLICQASSQYKIPLEINLNGLRYGKLYYDGSLKHPYPYREFWQIASLYQCPVFFGYDAHDPKTLQEEFRVQQVLEILEGIYLNILEDFDIRRYRSEIKK